MRPMRPNSVRPNSVRHDARHQSTLLLALPKVCSPRPESRDGGVEHPTFAFRPRLAYTVSTMSCAKYSMMKLPTTS